MRVLPGTAYCMNLDRRPDRWRQVVKDFNRLQRVMNIDIERIVATDRGDNPQAGVADTFKRIIKVAKELSLEYVLIIEDDLFIVDPGHVYDCLNNAPDDWDILSGGVYHFIPKNHSPGGLWVELNDFCSLHFIIIRNTIYDKIINKRALSQHIDRSLGMLTKQGSVKTFVMYPMPCQQRAGFSDIRKRKTNDNRRNLPWVDHPDTLKG